MTAAEWAGRDLGERTVRYDERDAILYALSVGAGAADLDLIDETRLRVLPPFALTAAQWAPDVLAAAGVFDERSVHGAQELVARAELPPSGELAMRARVGNVWDKGSAAVVEVIVESDAFRAVWSLFAPGSGGFGGERGPGRAEPQGGDPEAVIDLPTFDTQAALYRLTGDRHRIHVDPEAAAHIGAPRPILQGLCTLAAATLPLARSVGAHPAELRLLRGRFTGQVLPGDMLQIRRWPGHAFDVVDGDRVVVGEGEAVFG